MKSDTADQTELLRWWHQYQAHLLNQEADLIRNGILQEMFALRRRLEVACQAEPPLDEASCDLSLADLKHLYTALENVCDRLASPFVQDSLPLALQHALYPWQDLFPLQVTLPQLWDPEPLEHTRLLLLLVQHLFTQLAQAPLLPQRSQLTLSEAQAHKTLSLHIQYDPLEPTPWLEPVLTGLAPFCQTFHLLTQGKCHLDPQTNSFALVLSWARPAVSRPNLLSAHS